MWWRSSAGKPRRAARRRRGVLAALGAAAVHPPGAGVAGDLCGPVFQRIRVLSRADLSFAQPIMALSYVPVAGFGGAAVSRAAAAVAGAGDRAILCGVWVISTGAHVNARPARRTGARHDDRILGLALVVGAMGAESMAQVAFKGFADGIGPGLAGVARAAAARLAAAGGRGGPVPGYGRVLDAGAAGGDLSVAQPASSLGS